MKKYKWILIALNFLVVLAVFNYNIIAKEQLLKEQLILLELMPLDPRSIMQGDYMSLRYAVADYRYDEAEKIPQKGFIVLTLDANKVAKKLRIQEQTQPLKEGEFLIKYKKNKTDNIPHTLKIGAESYFFQETKAEKYEKAKYGALRVDKKGNSILEGLHDEQFQKIE